MRVEEFIALIGENVVDNYTIGLFPNDNATDIVTNYKIKTTDKLNKESISSYLEQCVRLGLIKCEKANMYYYVELTDKGMQYLK